MPRMQGHRSHFSTAPGTKCDHRALSHHVTHRHHRRVAIAAQGTLSTPCAPPLAPTVLTASTRKCSVRHSHLFTAVLWFPVLFASLQLLLGPFETACHAGKKTRPDAVSKAAAPNPVRCVPLVAVVVVFVAVRHSISGLCRWR